MGWVPIAVLTASLLANGPDNAASYQDPQPNAFMTSWLLLGPIPVADGMKDPEEAAQKKAFATDLLAQTGGEAAVEPKAGLSLKAAGKELAWKHVSAKGTIIDLAAAIGNEEFAVAYAYAEFVLPEKRLATLGLGSDDGIKVWLNGKLIHDNWVARAIRPDDDLIPIELAAGTNRLLLKVQNIRGAWGFACRLVGQDVLTDRLARAATTGDIDMLRRLVAAGADVNARSRVGLTPLHAAKIYGQTEAVAFLLSQKADSDLSLPPTEQVVEAVFKRYTAGYSPGAAVLVARDGKILYQQGFGYANLEHRVPITPETKFRIGSITKQFTAAAILKLQEQGKLAVSDTLATYFPDFPNGDKVTIHHLLTHTSGIRSYTGKPDFLKSVRLSVAPDDLIQSFKNDPFEFEPGTKWAYNNSGYFLLGQIVHKASGQAYGEFLKTQFFDPLEMKDTGVHHWSEILRHEAQGYSYEGGEFRKADNWDMSRAGGAGALYSTVGDLYRWNEAVFGGKVLTPASLKAAFTPVLTSEEPQDQPKQAGYGYGWGVGQARGLSEISHNGGLHGFNSSLLRMDDQRFTVAVLCNALPAPPGLDAGTIAHEVATLYLWEKMAARPVLAAKSDLPAEVLDSYVGRYDYGAAVLNITREGQRLFAQLTGQPKFEIFPKSETKFFWKVVDAQITFVKGDDGKVVRAVHRQGGQTINAARLQDVAAVKVDADTLAAYAGKYQLGAAILTVTKEGDHLFVQLTGQPKFECFAKSETEFVLKGVNAQLAFAKNKEGKVAKVVLEQGGQKLEAARIEE